MAITTESFLRLNENWQRAYDSNQWIVHEKSRSSRVAHGWFWKAVAFIGSNKDILLRVLQEKGIAVDQSAQEYIDAMPYLFRDWLALPVSRRLEPLIDRSSDLEPSQDHVEPDAAPLLLKTG